MTELSTIYNNNNKNYPSDIVYESFNNFILPNSEIF